MIFLLIIAPASQYSYQSFAQIQARIQAATQPKNLSKLTDNPDSYLLQQYQPAWPTLLLIGGFHGNEVTGSIAILEFMEKYLEKDEGIEVNVIVMPVGNPQGYAAKRRQFKVGEGWVDPNRDYPYDNNQTTCCVTSLCKNLFKLYYFYNITITLTFHAGQSSITYPPGDFSHKTQSSDHQQYKDLSAFIMQGFPDRNDFNTGTMQSVVYPLKGAFEDWAYYWGWDRTELMRKCYPTEILANFTMKGLVILVENGFVKLPFNGYGDQQYFTQPIQFYYGPVVRAMLIIKQTMFWLAPTVILQKSSQKATIRATCPHAQCLVILQNGQQLQLQLPTPLKALNLDPRLSNISSLKLTCNQAYPNSHVNMSTYFANKQFVRLILIEKLGEEKVQKHNSKWFLVGVGVLVVLVVGVGVARGIRMRRRMTRWSQLRDLQEGV